MDEKYIRECQERESKNPLVLRTLRNAEKEFEEEYGLQFVFNTLDQMVEAYEVFKLLKPKSIENPESIVH